ncbi:MAG: hypothetical protein ACK4NW_09510 [Roseinatronobacter sp.]
MAGLHRTGTTRRRQVAEDLPDNLRPLPKVARRRPFWLELGFAVIFSLAALVSVSTLTDQCRDANAPCHLAPDTDSLARVAPDGLHADEPLRDDAPTEMDRAVLTHAFAPLPLSFEDRTTRHYVLPPGQSMLDLATEQGRIALDDVALIAVVRQNGIRHALVRLPDGRILRLQQGDLIDGGTVAAISDDAIYLLDANRRPRALVLGG